MCIRDSLYRVEGRADGIFFDGEGLVTIDEIKSTAAPLSAIGEDFNLAHWAQGECYAYFYCLEHGLEAAAVRLTYFQVDTEDVYKRQEHDGAQGVGGQPAQNAL